MPVYVGPIVDTDNPLYCPAFQHAGKRNTWTLKKPVDFVYDASYNLSSSRKSTPHDYNVTNSPSDLACARKQMRQSHGKNKRKFEDSDQSDEGFTDMLAPTKYAKSESLGPNSSFSVLLRRERLDYDAIRTSSSIARPSHPDCCGAQHMSLSSIALKLDSILPGIRLHDRLKRLKEPSAQALFVFLAENGYITEAVLDVLGESDLDRMELTREMFHDHYNMYCSNLYRAFGKPQKYQALTELSLCGLKLDDTDIIQLHHLPRLSILLLDDTGVGNEGIFLLVPLKKTLTRLSLAGNPHVGEDSVPAMLLLRELVFLSIVGTSIEMGGLRRLAKTIHAEKRIMDIEIPAICETYIDNIHSKYLVDIKPPYIKDPTLCSMLTVTALKRNLEVHAKQNPNILVSGSSQELSQRLAEILRTRQLDTMVLELLDG